MSFHTKYRPATLESVIGQDGAVAALRSAIEHKSHAFLFHGPAGTGKTTLARITASMVGVDANSLSEIDAASKTGVDDMRQVVELGRYRGLGESAQKAIILDEAHRLSKNAWDALLKVLEEPPEHLYWMLCTTAPEKVPDTIRSRCTRVALKAVHKDDICDLLFNVADAEKLKASDEVLNFVARQAQGSPRNALTFLAAVADCKTTKEAAAAIDAVVAEGDDPALALARYLGQKNNLAWERVAELLPALLDQNAEGVRIVVAEYLAKVLAGTERGENAALLATRLEPFVTPFADGRSAPLLIAIAKAVFTD